MEGNPLWIRVPAQAAGPACMPSTGADAGVEEGYRSRSPRMNSSTARRASSSLYCSGGDFMK